MKEPEVAKEIISTMPEPEEILLDERGDTFDGDQHEVDSDGKPRKTKGGFFHKKRGGVSKVSGAKSSIASVDTPSEDLSYQACGSSTAEIIFIMGQALGGQEWVPVPDERRYMSDAWAQYYKAKEVKDLPPGLIVATAMISYAMPRFSRPETKTRLQKASHWIKMRFSKKYRKLHESHTNSGNDRKRKEHASSSTE